jgi:hypothetical protein
MNGIEMRRIFEREMDAIIPTKWKRRRGERLVCGFAANERNVEAADG